MKFALPLGRRDAASLAAFFRRNYSPLNSGFNAAKDIRRAVERIAPTNGTVLCRNLVDEHSLWGSYRKKGENVKGFKAPPLSLALLLLLYSVPSYFFLFLLLRRIPFLFEPRLRTTDTVATQVYQRGNRYSPGKRCSDPRYTGKD